MRTRWRVERDVFTSTRRRAWVGLTIAALLAAAMLSGCGKGDGRKAVYPVRGKVLVGVKPPVGALVVLHPVPEADPADWPEGFPRALVQEDGAFHVYTYATGDGAPAGDYKLTIQWFVKKQSEQDEQHDKLKGRYAEVESAPVQVHVEPRAEGNEPAPLQATSWVRA